MLVKFVSDAYENIVMFEKVAKELISMMGHSGEIPGALTEEQIPEALAMLQSALEKQRKAPSKQGFDDEEEEKPVSLSNRAFPLVNMLKSAAREKADVLWDYQ
ncbi:DUF1840 domain-containing protein [Legionella sp. 16cNR16C]|uniref:DUF1840 domain-containing protein n=1 Tax=Legionella sp. 16cNR16C TaxID=2905656 RepID=UPI001E4403E6|nr:DUF1840 domain-containing protein [Legionella sp. 16cNR16C]MCE3045544.1 DUF1840 domain-containing protein [Legionella sp. 16cNR16C]